MVLLCLEREFLVSVLCYSLIMLKNDFTLLSAFILLSLLADVCSVSYSVGVVKSSFLSCLLSQSHIRLSFFILYVQV